MSTRSLFYISCCTLLGCVLTGCYSHHQYPYGGTYPGPYGGAPGPYQMAPGNVPPGTYDVQPNLGQPVPTPQGGLPATGTSTYNDAFPNNANKTNYDGVDSQWTQPVNRTPNTGNVNETPFGANPTASGTNTNPGSGLNNNPSGNQSVPSYKDPNDSVNPNDQFLENKDPFPSTPQNSFPGNADDQFESNKSTQPPSGNSTQMNDQFTPQNSSNDQFESNAQDQFQQNDNEGFSVPRPVQESVQQQGFESSNDSFETNPKKFKPNPNDTFEANPLDNSQKFQPPVKSTPGIDDVFGPNSSLRKNSSSQKVSHANHQTRTSGPQLVQSDRFMTPAKFQAASFELPADSSNQNPNAQSPSPFSYDKQQYRWLRGIIEFDEQEKHWNITYNATPDKTDKFGGNIVLIDEGKLNPFKNGDVVLIDGKIDGSRQDKMGKPFYLISKAQKLVPKK
ncbi:MAG: hypothetical protein P1V19_13620 [Gimesia sp.]|nr:hypothetical protein [Gimesia sp.]